MAKTGPTARRTALGALAWPGKPHYAQHRASLTFLFEAESSKRVQSEMADRVSPQKKLMNS
jgi:hypothetical protein